MSGWGCSRFGVLIFLGYWLSRPCGAGCIMSCSIGVMFFFRQWCPSYCGCTCRIRGGSWGRSRQYISWGRLRGGGDAGGGRGGVVGVSTWRGGDGREGLVRVRFSVDKASALAAAAPGQHVYVVGGRKGGLATR